MIHGSGAIAIDPEGNLFVADRGQREIGGGAIYEFTAPSRSSTFATALNDPQGGLVFAVPEPSVWLLPLLAGIWIGAFARRRPVKLMGDVTPPCNRG